MRKKIYKIELGRLDVPEKLNPAQLAVIRKYARKKGTAILMKNGQEVQPDGSVKQFPISKAKQKKQI